MLLRVTVVVTPFSPCSHYCDGLYLHRHSWLIWSLSWQKRRQRKQYWKRKCTISFCSSTLFSFSCMPRLVRMLTLGLLRQNWWVWQLECGIILIFFLSWLPGSSLQGVNKLTTNSHVKNISFFAFHNIYSWLLATIKNKMNNVRKKSKDLRSFFCK